MGRIALLAGCSCKIYIHAEVSAGRAREMEKLGTDVTRVDGNYDASLEACQDDAARTAGKSGPTRTSWDGYMNVPRQVGHGRKGHFPTLRPLHCIIVKSSVTPSIKSSICKAPLLY